MNESYADQLTNGVEPTVLVGQLVAELVADGMDIEFTVSGGSMSPFILTADVITISHVPADRLRFGQVVAVPRTNNRIVIHRIIKRRRGSVLTRGDASRCLDPWVAENVVIGRIQRVARGGRDVRLGLGPERLVIAFLSRHNLLIPLLRPVRWVAKRVLARRR